MQLVSGDLDEPAMDQYVVSTDGTDFGYIQCYDLTAWNSGFGTQPEGTRGIDQFHRRTRHDRTRAMVRRSSAPSLDARLASGVPRIVTDPDPANHRAVRAYEKAGFREGPYGRYAGRRPRC